MKFPFVNLTLRVTPRLMVCRRRHPDSIPFVEVETVDNGRSYGSPNALGSTALQTKERC